MIPDELEQRILRLHFVEKWKVGTIARQCGVHHSTVLRVLSDKGLRPERAKRPSIVDPFLPFMQDTLNEYPNLPASRLHAMVVERGYTGSDSHFRRIVGRIRPRPPAEAFHRLHTLIVRPRRSPCFGPNGTISHLLQARSRTYPDMAWLSRSSAANSCGSSVAPGVDRALISASARYSPGSTPSCRAV